MAAEGTLPTFDASVPDLSSRRGRFWEAMTEAQRAVLMLCLSGVVHPVADGSVPD